MIVSASAAAAAEAPSAAPEAAPSSEISRCKDKILVIPPPIEDPRYNGWLILEAQIAFSNFHKLNCDPFISEEITEKQFDYLGPSVRRASTLKVRQMEFISERMHADQLIFLEIDAKKKNILHLKVYDLVFNLGLPSITMVDDLEISLDTKISRKMRSSFLTRAFLFLLPNVVSFGASDVRANMTLGYGYEEVKSVNRSTIPSIISSIQFSQIHHPDSYGLFDLSFAIVPGLFFFALDQYTEIRGGGVNDPSQTRVLHLRALGANANINGEVTLHSPLGATYFSLGIGPSYFFAKQEDQKNQKVFSDYDFRIKIGQRGFVTKNLFVSLEVDQMSLRRYIYYYDNLASTQNITRLSTSLGWYFPVSSFF